MRKVIDHRAVNDASRRTVTELLRRQHGIIHRAQAIAAGMTKAQVDAAVRRGRLYRVAPCIFSESLRPTDRARAWVASLWGGTGTVITGTAALEAAKLVTDHPATVVVYIDPDRSLKPVTGIRTVRSSLDPRDFRWSRGLRVTTPARAALDLARWGAADDYLPMLLRIGAVTLAGLRDTLGRMTKLPGYVNAYRAVEAVLREPWSPPERDLHAHLDAAAITGWRANAEYRLGGESLHPDLSFDAIKLAVEVEGAAYHSEALNREAFERDARRRQILEENGWFVLRFTPRQIRDNPDAVIATIIAKIRQLCVLHGLPATTYLTVS